MNRAQKVSRLVVELNNAIPEETEYLVVLMALSKLQMRVLELMYENDAFLVQVGGPIDHKGISHYRCSDSFNELEKRFFEAWQNEQKNWPLLDYILSPTEDHMDAKTTQRDATVAASIIQWLGSPVGQAFLRDVLELDDEN